MFYNLSLKTRFKLFHNRLYKHLQMTPASPAMAHRLLIQQRANNKTEFPIFLFKVI